LNVDGKSATEAQEYILQTIPKSTQDAIVLLRIIGTLGQGTIQDVGLDEIIKEVHKRGAFHVLRNTAKLQSMSFEEENYEHAQADIDTVEKETIEEHIGQIPLPELDEEETTKKLLQALELQQIDGETKTTFSNRVIDTVKEIVKE
jgi:hypothetical protein